jgi:hypothetical protein
MLTAPYSIYVNKRPLRVAFLIEDKPESIAIIDAVFKYNRDRWGGRYNPIVLTNGQELTDAWWSLLEAVDPDVVKSFVPLSDDLLGAIDRRISPYLILPPDPQETEDGRCHIRFLDQGLSLLPTALNVRMASRAIDESSLVLFETDRRETDPLIRRFVEFNFGGYSHPIYAVSRALEDVRTQPYRVTDAATLVVPLTELSDFRAFTYPIQLCSIPKEAMPDVEYDKFGDAFHVVIGGTLTDLAYFWNRPATAPQWRRTYLNEIWLPNDMAADARLTRALSAWLQRSADPGGSGKGSIRFVSLSLSQEQLQEIVHPLTSEIWVPRHVEVLTEIPTPKVHRGLVGPPGQDKMDLYRATGMRERLTLQEPDVLPGPSLGEAWMADLYIEFRPERDGAIRGRTLWWQLPRLNSLARQMFSGPSRILRTRYPSVLMRRGSPRLDITLLDDISLFAMLAVLPNDPISTLDAREGKQLSGWIPYLEAWPSEKGRYLSGLLDLFGGLFPATHALQQRYWRRLFDLLSRRAAHTDAKKLNEVGNTLRKRLGQNRAQFYQDDKDMTWLANYVLKVARSLPAASRDLPFRVFEDEAKKEVEDFNSTPYAGEETWIYSEEGLLQALTRLTERGVLLMGVQARCPSCGYRDWHHIDEARQMLHCRGCNTTFAMPPEPHWHYRLNSLARAAYAEHGLLPVVLVLGQLLMNARSAFAFAPCLDLFEFGTKGPVGDLDIAVILDGLFVIGEVKQSRDLFDEATFAKMEKVARRLLPDVLLFASMDRQPTRLITKELERLSHLLGPLGIEVQWYQLHQRKFDPDLVE